MATITITATYDADGALRIVVPGAKGRPGEEARVVVEVENGWSREADAIGEACGSIDDPTFVAPERPTHLPERIMKIADAFDGGVPSAAPPTDDEHIAAMACEMGVRPEAFRDPAAIGREAVRLGVPPERIRYVVPGGATALRPVPLAGEGPAELRQPHA